MERTLPWTAMHKKIPPQMIDEWDYIDQRALRRYNISRPFPRVKLAKNSDPYPEDESEIGMDERGSLVTYLHDFPNLYLPYLTPSTPEITVGSYFYVSIHILLFLILKKYIT